MNKTSNAFLALIFCLLVTILMLPTDKAVGQEGPFAELKEKMANISEAEHESLQTLFVLMQQIEEIEKEKGRMAREIGTKHEEIEDLKASLAKEEIAYTQKREDLKQVLRSYQRMGTATYLEIILNSESLAMLLKRVNILRDLTRNTGKLMESLEASKVTLLTTKTNLAEKISMLEDHRQQLRESLTKKQQLREQQDNYLASLNLEREYYQEHLADLEQNWDELKTSVPVIIQELTRIINEENIPLDNLKISIGLRSVKIAIHEKVMNDLISEHSSLPKIDFRFYPSHVEISMPDNNLVLSGHFVIQGADTLKFEVKEGSFYGLPLNLGAIDDLFLKGDLLVNLKLPLNNYTLDSIKTTEGSLEWTIRP